MSDVSKESSLWEQSNTFKLNNFMDKGYKEDCRNLSDPTYQQKNFVFDWYITLQGIHW